GVGIDRHVDGVCRLERRDLRGADRGRPARQRGERRALSRRHARGAAQAQRAVVSRRVVRDLAQTRLTMLAPAKPDAIAETVAAIAAFIRGGTLEATRPNA